MNLDPEHIARGIQARRTIKPPQYTDQKITREDMEWILDQAKWAPTHGKTEPWRFRVYTGASLEDLSGDLIRLYHATTPKESVDPSKLKKMEENPTRCSHALLISACVGSNPKIPETEEVIATSCAVHNICLAARSKGIASFWSTGPMMYHEQAGNVFCLEPNKTTLGILYLGYPKNPWPTVTRNPTSDYVRWMD